MSKTIKTAILILVLCLGAVLISGCTLLKWRQILPKILSVGIGIEKTCCQECLDFISKTPDSEKCLDNSKINKECREFFEKNPDKEEDCLEGKIVVSSFIPPSIDGLKLGDLSEKCDHQYVWWRDLEEIEKRFKGKTWSGTFSSDHHCPDGKGYSYDVKITGLQIVFDSVWDVFVKTSKNFKKVGIWSPCSFEGYYSGMGLNLAGSGNITYSIFTSGEKAASWGWCNTRCTVTNDPIPFNIKGKIYFTDEGVKINLSPEKIGVDTQEILERCGQEDSNCDAGQILEDTTLYLKGYCDGDYCDGTPAHCVMNTGDYCGNNWYVDEIIGEGDVELVNDRDIKLNTKTGACFVGDNGKDFYLTGTLYLK